MSAKNMKLDLDMFNLIHQMHEKFPKMSNGEIANYVKGVTGITISRATVRNALKHDTYDELEDARRLENESKRKKHVEEVQDEHVEEPDSLTDELKKVFFGEEDTNEDSAKAITITGNGSEFEREMTLDKLFTKYFVCPGKSTYPDETIGSKINGIAAGNNCTKKELVKFSQVIV